MKPVRVVHCVAGLSNGGYESLIMNLYRCIDREQLQFDFISSFPGVFEEEIYSLGGQIHHIPFITQKGPFVYRHALDRVLNSHPEYKIIHSHMDKFSGLVMARAKKAGIPVRIAHSHATGNEGGLAFQLVKDYYGKMVLPNATHLFACGEAAARWMYGDQADRAFILKNGVDLQRFTQGQEDRCRIRSELNLTADQPVYCHVGRFYPVKNHPFLLKVFAVIRQLQPTAVLLLVGDGPDWEAVRSQAADMGLSETVRFLGPRQDIPSILAAADCFLFPSLREGLPVTVVEAQAAGLPVIASSAITSEVCVSSLVHQLSLEDPAEVWAKCSIDAACAGQKERSCPVKQLSDAGYDIRRTARELQDFYLSLAQTH